MGSIQSQRILERIKQGGPGKVYTPKDFLDLATRAGADQTLSRLTTSNELVRLNRGLYYRPKHNERLNLDIPPDPDEVADAIARQTGSRAVPSGAVAANRLGLSTQVPARPVYLTDGKSREVQVGQLTVQLKHVALKELPTGSRVSAIVFQALRHLGKSAADDRTMRTLRQNLSQDELREVAQDAKYAAGWIAAIIFTIVALEEARSDG